jgi:hypothetical protein
MGMGPGTGAVIEGVVTEGVAARIEDGTAVVAVVSRVRRKGSAAVAFVARWGAFDLEPVTARIVHAVADDAIVAIAANVAGGGFVGGRGIDPVTVGGSWLGLAGGGEGRCWQRGVVWQGSGCVGRGVDSDRRCERGRRGEGEGVSK